MPKVLPSIDRLRELLVYCPMTGQLRWKIGRPGASAGALAGSEDKNGYIVVRVDRQLLPAHQIAWALFYGEWAMSDIDHRDTIKPNNKILNLRKATDSQNLANSPTCKSNTSGIKGVTWDTARGMWKAQLTFEGKNLFLGRFESKELAGEAYFSKAVELFGEFARAA